MGGRQGGPVSEWWKVARNWCINRPSYSRTRGGGEYNQSRNSRRRSVT